MSLDSWPPLLVRFVSATQQRVRLACLSALLPCCHPPPCSCCCRSDCSLSACCPPPSRRRGIWPCRPPGWRRRHWTPTRWWPGWCATGGVFLRENLKLVYFRTNTFIPSSSRPIETDCYKFDHSYCYNNKVRLSYSCEKLFFFLIFMLIHWEHLDILIHWDKAHMKAQ